MSTPEVPTPPAGTPAVGGTPTPTPAPTAGAAAAADVAASASTSAPAAAAKPAAPANPLGTPGYKPKPPAEPLQGWRAAFEHTGVPRRVLNAKPRLPSRNWSIFLGIVGSISYLYYDDRKRADKIRNEYIDKVKFLAEQPTVNALEQPRKVKVYGARWPEDDESDRALRYFRKYVKPYLVAAAIDYDQVHAPLYGSIARIVRAEVVKKRRQALGLEAADDPTTVPGVSTPATEAQRELDGGTILVGRPALKEYLSGLHAGWSHGVDEWVWDKAVEKDINSDFFNEPTPEVAMVDAAPIVAELETVAEPVAEPAPKAKSRFGFFSRSTPAPAVAPAAGSAAPPGSLIPAHLHAAPTPLPPQAPILLVPFANHLGFKQIPYMIYDFFTEAKRTQAGAEAAYALIMNQTRPFTGPESGEATPDTAFGTDTEKYYKKDYAGVPERNEKAKAKYYDELAGRLLSARQFARGEREITDAEKKSDKPITTEDDLRAEARKREMRWAGGLEGWNIVRPDTPLAWDPSYAGWLRVFDTKKGE